MPLIKPAHLVLCPDCKLHGHIVCADGTKSEKFASQLDAIFETRRLLNAGKIVLEEGDALAAAISESGLPHTRQDAIVQLALLKAAHENESGMYSLFDPDGSGGDKPSIH